MKKIIISILLILGFFSAFAQINTLYFNKNVYQSTELNPARQHSCRFSFGLPVLSSTYINLYNKNFAYKDFFVENSALPDTARFVLNLDGFYDNLQDVNYIFFNQKISLGYVAFWIRDFYISFGGNINSQFNFAYPKGMLKIKDGIYFDDGTYISFSKMAIQTTAYTETYLGVSKEIIPGLTIGGKIKLLHGYGYAGLDNFQLDWHVSTQDSDIFDWTFNTSYRLRNSAILRTYPQYDSTGIFSGVEMGTIADNYFNETAPMQIRKDLITGKGVALDFGVIYNYKDKLEASFSVTDLGFINWHNALTLETSEKEFTFSGADPGYYLGDNNVFDLMDDTTGLLNNLKDSMINDMIDTLLWLSTPTVDTNKFRVGLNTNIRAAAAYTPADWITLGLMYHGMRFNKQIHSSFTLSSTIMFWKGWSYTLNYTMRTKSFNNIGMGLSYKIGPFQTYLLMENLAVPTMAGRYFLSSDKAYNEGIGTKWIKSSKLLNFQFGLNFVFGCRDRRDFGLID